MGNIASSAGGGHWDMSQPQPRWKPKPKSPKKKPLWLPRQNSGSDSND